METASSGEVFVAVASGLAVIAWALTYWNAHRKGKSVYREGTPRAMHIYGYVTIALVTIVAVVCTVSLFLPGDLFGIIFG